jgi:GNAT superfamily N-acetyltransferase
MRPEDAAAVADLTTQLGYPSSASDISRRFEHIQARRDSRLLVAEDISRAIVGWIHVQALYALEADGRAEIWGLVVSESARRTGIGRLLIEAAEEWAVAQGFNVMGVRSNRLRTGSHEFYQHLGYEITKTQNVFRKQLG